MTVRLFGREWGPEALRARTGDVAQLAGATRVSLADGPEAGVDAVDVRTGGGLRFLVLTSRGLDIADAEFEGLPLAWRSSTGRTHPSLYDPRGRGWLKGFYGGLLVTCGYTTAGAPSVDAGEELGQHGRASYLPAGDVGVEQRWVGDEYRICVRGTIREATVFGEHLVVRRTITTQLGSRSLRLEDDVENAGARPTPLMLLYHINLGFPLLDAGAELIAPTRGIKARDADAAEGLAGYRHVHEPVRGYAEQVFYHDLERDPDGVVEAGLVNRGLRDGLGIALRFDGQALPRFIQWKMLDESTYVMGLEPANCLVEGRAAERARNTLVVLHPSERRRFWIEIRVLAGTEVSEFSERIGRKIRGG
jgi:Domain of unknown function (DUF4432)